MLEEASGVGQTLEDDLDHVLGSDGLGGDLLQLGEAALEFSPFSTEAAKAVGQKILVGMAVNRRNAPRGSVTSVRA